MTTPASDERNNQPLPPLFVSYSDQQLLGLSRREIQRMVHRRQLPEPRSFGRRKLFDYAAVQKALGTDGHQEGR